jgi:hypothetical protein
VIHIDWQHPEKTTKFSKVNKKFNQPEDSLDATEYDVKNDDPDVFDHIAGWFDF